MGEDFLPLILSYRESIDMEKLIDLFQAGTTVKEFKTKNLSFKMKTLSTDELLEVLRHADLQSTSQETKIFTAKKLTIAYALESVNGVEILAIPEIAKLRADSKDQNLTKQELLLKVIGSFDAEIIEDLYRCYDSIVQENNKKREELKKDLVAQ
jgi:hypothetical protein